MKTLLNTLIIISLSTFVRAQNFTLTTDTLESTHDINASPVDTNYILNISGNSVGLNFDLLTNTIPSNANWSVTLCTHLQCLPSIPGTYNIGTIANGDQGYITLHVGFGGTPGTGEVSLKIYESSNPSNADTMVFIYHAVDMVSINESTVSNGVFVSPNPASSFIEITGDLTPGFKYRIVDTMGKEWYSQKDSTTIDVSHLPKGMYTLLIYQFNAVKRCRFLVE